VIEVLNRELRERVEPDELVAADAVLRAAISDARERARAALLVRPPSDRDPADADSTG
jgi:hypothetical protein